MANNADPDQLASDLDLHYLQKQGISGISRTRVKNENWHLGSIETLTHLCLAFHKRDSGKQCRPRPDARECSI